MGVALITGCSSGFGLLSAVTLARHGFSVVATMRNVAKRGRLDEACTKAGVKVIVVPLDVNDPASMHAGVAQAEREAGPVEVLVNNAGYGVGGFVHDLSMDEIRAQMETNFFGAVAMVKAVLPGMVARRAGRIINVSSIAGRMSLPVMGAYSASKFALEGFTEALRAELLPFGVYASLVEPGTFKTDIFFDNRRVAAAGKDPGSPFVKMSARMEKLVDGLLQRNRQDPQWVADVILKAATARKPRLRYLVGWDALAQGTLKRFGPWPLIERVIQSQTKLREHLPDR